MNIQKTICERQVETYLKKRIESEGGLTFKFVSPSNAGVPDRIVLKNGKAFFVELKRPNGKLRPLQQHIARKIYSQGFSVYVIDTKEGVDEFVRKELAPNEI